MAGIMKSDFDTFTDLEGLSIADSGEHRQAGLHIFGSIERYLRIANFSSFSLVSSFLELGIFLLQFRRIE